MIASAVIANLRANATRNGLPLPQKFTTEADRIATRYASPATAREDLADLVATAVDKGIDPFTDDAVRTALLRSSHAPAVAAALTQAREVALFDLLAHHKSDLLAGWRDLWAEHGATLSRAAAALPGVDFERPGSVGSVGAAPDRLTLWADAHAAAVALVGIAGAVAGILRSSRPEWTCLVGAPLDAATHDALVAGDHARIAWGAALHGVDLDLVTTQDDLDQRVAQLRAERQRIANSKPVRPSYL